MKTDNKDIVRFSGKMLYCRFRETGLTESLVSIEPGARLSIDKSEDGESYAILGGNLPLPGKTDTRKVIETFRTREDASAGLDLIERALIERSNRWVKLAKWTGLAIVGILALMMVIGLLAQKDQEQAAPASRYGVANSIVPGVNPVTGAFEPPVSASKMPEKVDMSAIKDLAKIQFGKGKPAVYVFADSRCSACREVDPMIERTGKSYAIIPVAILGDDSAREAVRIMCSDDPAKAWKSSIKGADATLSSKDEAKVTACANAIIKNMTAFRELGMLGTPTLVMPNGKVAMIDSEEQLKQLLK